MLPKVQSAAEVVALDLLLSQVEHNAGLEPGHIGIEAQIETAQGLINVEAICAASPRLESIVFGPADFAASIGMPVTTIDETIHHAPSNPFSYVFAKILMAGRANGLHVIDGPFLKVRDLEALRYAASDLGLLRLRRQVGAHPRPGDRAQRGLLTEPRALRQVLRHPGRLPLRDRERATPARSCSATR